MKHVKVGALCILAQLIRAEVKYLDHRIKSHKVHMHGYDDEEDYQETLDSTNEGPN